MLAGKVPPLHTTDQGEPAKPLLLRTGEQHGRRPDAIAKSFRGHGETPHLLSALLKKQCAKCRHPIWTERSVGITMQPLAARPDLNRTAAALLCLQCAEDIRRHLDAVIPFKLGQMPGE
jgi:hypothetical protein